MSNDEKYKKLGISKDASLSDIKKAYRKKALELHPDKSLKTEKEAEKEFKELNNAYHSILDYQNLVKEKEKEFFTETSKFTEKSYENENLDPQMNIFDILEFLFSENFERSNILNLRDHSRQEYYNQTINLNRCSGNHDRFTICLKCGKY